MSIIETIQNKKGLSVGAAAGLIVVAAVIMMLNLRSGIPGDAKKAFYSIDDGASYFVDSLNKVYPFEHDGKQAYRAYVFKCNKSGKLFVAYLERFNDAGQAKMADLLTQPHEQAEAKIAQLFGSATEVKRPGATQWFAVNSGDYSDIVDPSCPDGGKDVQCISP